MTAAAPPAPAPGRGGLPILGPLSLLGRVALISTIVASAAAILLDFAFHADSNLVFFPAAASILGLAWVVGGVHAARGGRRGGGRRHRRPDRARRRIELARRALLMIVYLILAVSFFEFV